MKVAVVGATGLVGSVMLKVLEERNFPVTELIPVASEKSVGKEVLFKGQMVKVVSVQEALAKKPHLAIFSAGASVSKMLAPQFAKIGCKVVDNSSAWRMDPDIKLVIPEVNGDVLTIGDMIIANPNCSTIQMLVALNPLHQEYGIKRIVVSTYQSITGTGVKAVTQMENERAGVEGPMVYPHPIDKNCIPQCDVFLDNRYTKEEVKLIVETHKILGDKTIAVTPTAVRVPVVGGHSESITVELKKSATLDDITKILSFAPGVVVLDNPAKNEYPMARMAEGKDSVFVGRIRPDLFVQNCFSMWVVADNLRKGAATNAIQIAELLLAKNWI
ncbi:aspartate-semialdehyde dehydrogenase [Williamwhitmania taraxaci]|uniref:Aspartate-semialdehyde dehydrogenase n=1 Tax=Williamwhitmania taraxaci TaxID=1640674 RepID=A0A1G6REW9_9BACT|nr:aspartate-semialdehyde dehydrogenase [Williamwhitmania taraxaci]SDD02844.1 aspartate-semialdehyde dehydrogenase [Williamwhitmania taraxaci]